MNLLAISRLLGHAKLQTTQRYLRVDTVELATELRRKHPRNAVEVRLCREQRERRHTP
jgi:site-specific recombinase XerD